MVENDTFTYHVKKPSIDQKSRVFHSLITQERARKLELLIHLIANSRQALVVCGPEGIGKSTMLKVLEDRKEDSWLFCLVQCNTDLSFEEIQERMAQAIHQVKQHSNSQVLSGTFKRIESRHKKMVLIFADAGYLAPGLINTIIEYAAVHTILRVIFVLTNDELDEKISSDNALDDCHLIEIPPLSEKQCGEFLHYLAMKPPSQVAFNEINDDLIASVYQESQGIPGRIVGQLPVLECARQTNHSLLILVAAVVGLVVIALGVQWFSGSEYNLKPGPVTAPDVQK